MKIQVSATAGPLAAVGGLMWTLLHVWLMASPQDAIAAMQRPFVALVGVAVLFMALGWLSIYRRVRHDELGRIPAMVGFVGTLLVGIGALLSAANASLIAGWALFAGQLLTSVGLLTFGVLALMRHLLPRLNALPLVMALAYIPSAILGEATLPSEVISALALSYGIGWLALGIMLWITRWAMPAERA